MRLLRSSMFNTTLCYIERDGKYLMMHRTKKKDDVNKDKWIGIGGKIEDGESPKDCVIRECLEETGLLLKSVRYRAVITFVQNGHSELMHLFTSSDFEGEMKSICDEGELAWVDKKEVYNLPMWAGDDIFLKLLDIRDTFFSLKLVYTDENLVGYELD